MRSLAAGFLYGGGHSYLQIGIGSPQTTVSGAHVAGSTILTVAASTLIEPGKVYQIRAADAANREFVQTPRNADTSGTTVPLLYPLAHAHADGEVVFDPSLLPGERLARMLGNPTFYANHSVSGAILAKGGVPTSQGGYNAVMQTWPLPANNTGATSEPSPGVNLFLWGLNDVGDAAITSAGTTAIYQAWRQAMRSVLSRVSLSLLYEAETSFSTSAINTTFTNAAGSAGTNGGSWSVTSSTLQNSGTGYRSTAATGDKLIHSLPAGWAGPAGSTARCVDICFLGNYVGGSFPASTIDFTVDGVAAYPVGSNASGAYGASNKFSTVDQNPAYYGTAVPCTARLLVTPTGSAQTIVASAGAGGMAVDWIGYEADNSMPTIWVNTSATPGATAQTIAAIPTLNTTSQAILAEFTGTAVGSSTMAYADVYTVMSPAGSPVTKYWTSSVDSTHPNTLGDSIIAEEAFKSFQRLPLTIHERSNL